LGDRINGNPQVMRVEEGHGPTHLLMRQDLRNHSPDGPNWGYGGSGPAQLALALLADVAPDFVAERLYQRFKFEVVAGLGHDAWTLEQPFVYGWVLSTLCKDPDLLSEVLEAWKREELEQAIDQVAEEGYQ
jgi:hypothetical protein